MKQRNAIEWMLNEVEGLVGSGVITPECGEALRRHYGDRLAETETGGRTVLLSVIGAALIGAGVILLIAHNWDELGRPARTVLSMLPLLVSGALSIFAACRREGSVAWRESTGVAHCAGVAASIALVSQTYHISGSLSSFLFTWLVLILPLPYLLRAICPAMIYLAGIAVWAGYVFDDSSGKSGAPGYWLFWAAMLPFGLSLWRHNRLGKSTSLMSVILGISTGFGLFFTGPLRGIWIAAFSGFFGTLYLAGALGFPERRHHPLRIMGGMGIAVLTVVFSFTVFWDNLSSSWPLPSLPFYAGLAFPCACAVLWSAALRKAEGVNFVAALFPWAALGANLFLSPLPAAVFFNLYGFVLALATAFRGLRERAALTLNAGLILFAALLVSRFMDSEFGALERGVAFILLGALILGANLWMLRRKEAAR